MGVRSELFTVFAFKSKLASKAELDITSCIFLTFIQLDLLYRLYFSRVTADLISMMNFASGS